MEESSRACGPGHRFSSTRQPTETVGFDGGLRDRTSSACGRRVIGRMGGPRGAAGTLRTLGGSVAKGRERGRGYAVRRSETAVGTVEP